MQRHRPAWYQGNVPWLFASRAARSFSQALLVVSIPLYVSAAGYSTLQVGYLLSLATVGSVIMTVAVGLLSDRYGRKPMLAGIAAVAATGAAFYALTTRFWVLALMGALASARGGGAGSGGGFGAFYPAEQALVAASGADRDRNSIFSSLSLIGVLAAAAGSLATALPDVLTRYAGLSAVDSFKPLFWLAASGNLAVALLTLPIREERRAPPDPQARAPAFTTWKLLVRLWLTNGLNGLAIGVLGPFLTYWFSVRYAVGAATIAALYTTANLATAFSYLVAPAVARRLGDVPTIVSARAGTVLLMAAMALSPTFLLAAASYMVRVMVNSVSIPIRQSFVMGISGEQSRSRVAAMGSLPSQGLASVSPTIASHLLQSVSAAAPIWLAAGALAVNAVLFEVFFRKVKPPEEE
jgi:MFS family permease